MKHAFFRNSLKHVFAIGVSAVILSYASVSSATESQYSIETDPATFLFSGYALHLRVSPTATSQWNFGIGTYAMRFPGKIIDTNSKNRNEGWQVTLSEGYGLFAEYFFNERRVGWLTGIQVAAQHYTLKNKYLSGLSTDFDASLIMPYLGYRWLSRNGYYVQPWAGFGYLNKYKGDTYVGDNKYDLSPITAFATLHLGYEF